ncbi:MAG: M48 family metallopeptidase [Pseudomonadota bacterium]
MHGIALIIVLSIIYTVVMTQVSIASTRRTLTERSRPLRDGRLQQNFAKMADALDLRAIDVNLYEVEQVNGLAAPDGRIFITRGFYEKFRSGVFTADELASVVAHELGHVALGHSRRRTISFGVAQAMQTGLGLVLSRFLPFISPLIVGGVASMVTARLSRDDEYEADEYATALLIKSGIGTEGQKSLFHKLDRMSAARGDGPPAWLRSHPKSEERIAAIEANEARWLG